MWDAMDEQVQGGPQRGRGGADFDSAAARLAHMRQQGCGQDGLVPQLAMLEVSS